MQPVLSDVQLRTEVPDDVVAIRTVIEDAFREHPHSRQTEAQVVDGLRRAGALSLSLVAVQRACVVGHAAIAPVGISGGATGWFGMGPLSVAPEQQGLGVGSALVWHGLRCLRDMRAAGCVVLGEPAYFGRFGFRSTPAMRLEGAPRGCFLVRPFQRVMPFGTVHLHEAFELVEASDWSFP
mgnify:CR=1 FL=1